MNSKVLSHLAIPILTSVRSLRCTLILIFQGMKTLMQRAKKRALSSRILSPFRGLSLKFYPFAETTIKKILCVSALIILFSISFYLVWVFTASV